MDEWKEWNYRSEHLRVVELQIQAYRKRLRKLEFQINAMIEMISEHASDELVDDLLKYLEEE